MPVDHLTERQQKWFASVQSGLERETGKSLAEWVAIARTCPEEKPRARLQWFKDTHGLLQNRATYVLGEAFPSAAPWAEGDALIDQLWADPAARAVFEAVEAAVGRLPGEVVRGPRKGYTAFSRKFQFASLRPVKKAVARLGLAVPPGTDARLEPAKNEGWSERLHSALMLNAPEEVDSGLEALLRAAWDDS